MSSPFGHVVAPMSQRRDVSRSRNSRRNTTKRTVVEPVFASAVEMSRIAVKSGTRDALIGTGRLLNLSARAEFLELLL